MFKDAKKELERLQAQLLAEEETQVIPLPPEDYVMDPEEEARLYEELDEFDDLDEELAEIQAMLDRLPQQPRYQNYSNNYGRDAAAQAYNTDKVEDDLDLDEYSEEVYEEEQPESLKGLVITACLLLAGIGAVLVWWAVRFL